MDKIINRSPIRNYKVKQPVVFAFNILLNHHLAMKNSHYSVVERCIRQNGIDNFILLPNITNVSMNIEQRADMLSARLKHISAINNNQKVHLLMHSFSGIDGRAAISMYDAQKYVSSLTTICTPHLGSRLIDNINKNPHKHQIERVDKIFEAVGLSQKNAYEFSTTNIEDFNEVAVDNPYVEYHSCGAQRKPYKVNDALRYG